MGYFDPIPGTFGHYTSPLEIIVTGTPAAITTLKAKLYLHNKAVQQQIRRLKLMRPRSMKHLQMIQQQIAELQPTEYVQCWADTPEGVSIPPGCYFMVETILNSSEFVDNPPMDIKWLGTERHYQRSAVEGMLKKKRAAIQCGTGTGKSRIIQVLSRTMAAAGKRVLVLVPSVELLKQTFFPLHADGSFSVGMLGGQSVPKPGCQVVVSTIQSAINIADCFDVIVGDEIQHAASATVQAIFSAAVNAEFVYGLSASPWRADGMTQLIWNFCGAIVFKYSGAQAIKEGFLSPLVYTQWPVQINRPPAANLLPIKKYIKLHSSDEYVTAVEKIVRAAIDKGRKVLVLYKSITCCDKLGARLGVHSANGKFRAPFYAFKKGESKLCIANISLLGEGIDVPDISTIIYCAGSVSEISVVQAFGRGTRIAAGKRDCHIVDVYPALPDWRVKAQRRKSYYQSHFEGKDFSVDNSTDVLTLIEEEEDE
jgi:superfamily II DNA or RNA helicase